MSATKQKQQHPGNRRKKYSGPNPMEPDPLSECCVSKFGGIIEYLDASCTAAVDSMRFANDGPTFLGGDEESAYDDIGTFHSHSTRQQDYGDTFVGDVSTENSRGKRMWKRFRSKVFHSSFHF